MTTPQRRWPAEWETHQATWMAWPCREEIWTNGLDKAQQAFAKVANTIAEFEPVKMLLNSEHLAGAKKRLSSNIELIEQKLDDSWARDFSPLWVQQGEQNIALNFKFNAWGEKFTPYDNDAKVANAISQYTNSSIEQHEFVLEGGAIHGNGQGTLLTTKECLLNPNRNPTMDKSTIESKLLEAFGGKQVIWLKHGLYGDTDTDGHIDNIACFVDDKTIISQKADDSASENYRLYAENRQVIAEHALELVEISEPEPRYWDGARMPLSYINYYVANDLVVMPAFGCQQDDEAKQVIQELYPNCVVKQLDANEILVGGGGIHCITMQQPLI